MSGVVVAQIILNESSDRVITGIYSFDRACGGVLAIPSGFPFPTTNLQPGEVFWNTVDNVVYRRNDANTEWVSISTGLDLPGSTGDMIYYDGYQWINLPINIDGYFLSIKNGIPKWIHHDNIRRLIHLAENGPFEGFASGAYREVTGTVFPTSIIWYNDSSKNKKIVEQNIVYNNNKTMDTITYKVYDEDGSTLLLTVTDSITYTNRVFEQSRIRTIT